MMFRNLLLAGLGGCIGSMLRYLAYLVVKSPGFPMATLVINIAGSLLIGFVIGFGLKNPVFETNWKIFLATGVCGGFTTFSAFSLENIHMLLEGKILLPALYITASVFLGILAAWLGYKLSTN